MLKWLHAVITSGQHWKDGQILPHNCKDFWFLVSNPSFVGEKVVFFWVKKCLNSWAMVHSTVFPGALLRPYCNFKFFLNTGAQFLQNRLGASTKHACTGLHMRSHSHLNTLITDSTLSPCDRAAPVQLQLSLLCNHCRTKASHTASTRLQALSDSQTKGGRRASGSQWSGI